MCRILRKGDGHEDEKDDDEGEGERDSIGTGNEKRKGAGEGMRRISQLCFRGRSRRLLNVGPP